MSAKRVWLIEGRDQSHEVIFRQAYPFQHYTEQQMAALLQALTAKSALSFSEIASALCRRGRRTVLLEIQRFNGQQFTLACGPSLDWTARVVPEDDWRLAELL